MRTDKIHAQIGGRIKLRMPVIKRVNGAYVMAGTWFYPVEGEVTPFSLNKRWITLTPEQVDQIIDAMTDFNTETVWIHDRINLEYSGKLVALPTPVAEPLFLHFQRRINATGEVVARNEVCISDEILAERYLKIRGVVPRSHYFTLTIDTLTLEDAVTAINRTGTLPSLTDN